MNKRYFRKLFPMTTKTVSSLWPRLHRWPASSIVRRFEGAG